MLQNEKIVNILGWMELCASIIKSGIKENDVRFLNSEWYECLKGIIKEYAHRYDGYCISRILNAKEEEE